MLSFSKCTLTPSCSYENSRICKDESPYYEDFDSFRIVLYVQDISAELSCLTWYISMELSHSNDTPFKTLLKGCPCFFLVHWPPRCKLSMVNSAGMIPLQFITATSIYNLTCAEANSTTDRQLSWCMNVKKFTSQQEKFTTGEKIRLQYETEQLVKLRNSPWALSSQLFA